MSALPAAELAAMAVMFPFVMLLQTLSGGAIMAPFVGDQPCVARATNGAHALAGATVTCVSAGDACAAVSQAGRRFSAAGFATRCNESLRFSATFVSALIWLQRDL
jgi:hypothetical protein